MQPTKTTQTILLSILFLFFLQALSDFIEAIYAFALLVTAFTIQVTSFILLFTPLLLLFFRKPPSRAWLLGIGYLAILARLVEPMLNPGNKLVAGGVSVGAFLLLFPILLQNQASVEGWSIGGGLAIAVSLSILFRTANSSLDISETARFQWISWLLAVPAVLLLWRMRWLSPPKPSGPKLVSEKRVVGLSIGLASVIVMIYFAFASPTVIARWTASSYPMIVTLLVVAYAIWGWLFNAGFLSFWLTRLRLLGWNLLFVISVVLTILPHQIAFPLNPESYPFEAPSASPLGTIFLFFMILLSPVLCIDFMLFARQISLENPSLHQIGKSFALAALFLLVIVFFHVFTTTYDYVPVVGPLFRDRFWFVYLLGGLGMVLPMLFLEEKEFHVDGSKANSTFFPLALSAIALLSLIALYFTGARPVEQQAGTQLKVMTYNIQQGFDAQGNKNLDGQLAVIQRVNPDILGLQESDTARVANGNVDAVRYFADHLDLYSYYGPTTTTGTFGIALLSKYPIQNPSTFFMYSTGEQTAAIHAEISAGGQLYEVFVTHLGNGGPIIQLEDLLARIRASKNVIAMGDFNFEPTTEQYALMTKTLVDSWSLKWLGEKETPGVKADQRIDHIFVSPGISVSDSEYLASPASDHPSMYTVIQP